MYRPEPEESYRVTTIELFFDLVFVFTITQLTGVFVRDMSPLGALRVFILFGMLWWIYSGYGWLTNTGSPTTTVRRLLLLVGMAGFLIVALATPHAFDRDGLAWGLGYLVIVLVHAGLYAQFNRHILRVLPGNVIAALLVIIAALLSGPWVYVAWIAAVLVPVTMPYLVPPASRFSLQAAHIVERHGLLVLITLGESVVAIGIGLSGKDLTRDTVVAAILALALVAALWWTYFTGDDERAEDILARADDARRTTLVMNGYFYSHIPIMIGIVACAAGMKEALGHATKALDPAPAMALAGGVALYLVGDIAFRRALDIGPARMRAAAAALCLTALPLGLLASAEAEIAGLLLILAGMIVVENRTSQCVATR